MQEKLRSIKKDDRVSAVDPSIPVVAGTMPPVDDIFELRSQIYQQNNEVIILYMDEYTSTILAYSVHVQ